MSWPILTDYMEAIQNPEFCFIDPELKNGTPEVNNLGLPKAMSGNFASVYQLNCSSWKYAIRCFIKYHPDHEDRYDKLSKYLNSVNLQYMVDFQFLNPGMQVNGDWYPILKMEWIHGESLSEYITNNLYNNTALIQLKEQFCELVLDLNKNSIAHGDLQHGNIIVSNGNLKLIDYDGMYIPDLKNWKSNELGHSNYQHPNRTQNDFGDFLDHFSSWVIYTSLSALCVEPTIWDHFEGGDECLLFKKNDFEKPFSSGILNFLKTSDNQELKALYLHLESYLNEPNISNIPPLNPKKVVIGPKEHPWWWHPRTPPDVDIGPLWGERICLGSTLGAWSFFAYLTFQGTSLKLNVLNLVYVTILSVILFLNKWDSICSKKMELEEKLSKTRKEIEFLNRKIDEVKLNTPRFRNKINIQSLNRIENDNEMRKQFNQIEKQLQIDLDKLETSINIVDRELRQLQLQNIPKWRIISRIRSQKRKFNLSNKKEQLVIEIETKKIKAENEKAKVKVNHDIRETNIKIDIDYLSRYIGRFPKLSSKLVIAKKSESTYMLELAGYNKIKFRDFIKNVLFLGKSKNRKVDDEAHDSTGNNRRFRLVYTVILGALFTVIAGNYVFIYKDDVLKYIKSRPSEKVLEKITIVDIEKNAYKKALLDATSEILNSNYETARQLYNHFLRAYPQSTYAGNIKRELSDLIDYRSLTTNWSKNHYDEKITACNLYLKNHNKGKFYKEVIKLRLDAINKYAMSIKKNIGSGNLDYRNSQAYIMHRHILLSRLEDVMIEEEMTSVQQLMETAEKALSNRAYGSSIDKYNKAINILNCSEAKELPLYNKYIKTLNSKLANSDLILYKKGYIEHDGKFYSPEEYRKFMLECGYIQYNGKWRSPSEYYNIMLRRGFIKCNGRYIDRMDFINSKVVRILRSKCRFDKNASFEKIDMSLLKNTINFSSFEIRARATICLEAYQIVQTGSIEAVYDKIDDRWEFKNRSTIVTNIREWK